MDGNVKRRSPKPAWAFDDATGYILAIRIEGTVPFYQMFAIGMATRARSGTQSLHLWRPMDG